MLKYSFEDIKTLLLKSIKEKYEAELYVILNHYEYMIIIYEDHCSFQKCGYKDNNDYIPSSGEMCFQTLDELYHAQLIDDISK